ncbi:MAG: hypothetical protein P8R42_09785 [Candidatus Binatia bacterium]|nr:hypothetical protein [Candidatus Binatia bacterium]
MSCRRIEELDLPGFLEDPTDENFLSFREHYPACRDCSAEIHIWTELHMELGADAHPSIDEILMLQDAPASLSSKDRTRLLAHVASCDPCTEEIQSLESFAPEEDFGAVAAAALPESEDAIPSGFAMSEPVVERSFSSAGRRFDTPAPRPTLPTQDEPEPDIEPEPEIEFALEPDIEADADDIVPWTTQVGRVIWTPAFAYAALLVVTLPLLYLRRDVVVEPIVQSARRPVTSELAPARKAMKEAVVAQRATAQRERAGAPAGIEKRDQLFALEGDVAIQPMAPPPARPAPARPASAAPLESMAPAPRNPPVEAVRDGDKLHVTVVTHLPGTGPLELRVVTSSGRELRQPVARPSEGPALEFTLPAAWLGAGQHRIELRSSTGDAETFDVGVPPASTPRRLG